MGGSLVTTARERRHTPVASNCAKSNDMLLAKVSLHIVELAEENSRFLALKIKKGR
jgi:hypothetical protein